MIPLDDLDYINSYPGIDWDDLKNKKILITGFTGFFGKWLTTALIYSNIQRNLDLQLFLVSRSSKTAFNHIKKDYVLKTKIEIINGDISSNRVYPTCDLVFHLAASSDSRDYTIKRRRSFETLVCGSYNLMSSYSQHENKCRILNVSSGSYYGVQRYKSKGIEESALPNMLEIRSPFGLYSFGKISSELIGDIYSEEFNHLEVINVRCFAFVGPLLPLNKHFAIGNFINDVLNNRDTHLKSNGLAYRSYLYSADLVVALLLIILKGKNRESYNLGSPIGYSIIEIAKRVHHIGKSNMKVIPSSSGDNQPNNFYIPNIDKLKKIGFNSYISLDDSISKTLKSFI